MFCVSCVLCNMTWPMVSFFPPRSFLSYLGDKMLSDWIVSRTFVQLCAPDFCLLIINRLCAHVFKVLKGGAFIFCISSLPRINLWVWLGSAPKYDIFMALCGCFVQSVHTLRFQVMAGGPMRRSILLLSSYFAKPLPYVSMDRRTDQIVLVGICILWWSVSISWYVNPRIFRCSVCGH